ncbi:hypothetical protein ANAPH2_01253 [Anaplasma phagocytophilum]|nr:hypothetical protein ANAPH2_01253 [Anaplasma phagocytophilum]
MAKALAEFVHSVDRVNSCSISVRLVRFWDAIDTLNVDIREELVEMVVLLQLMMPQEFWV